jgi:flagellar M-ring protein FliF
VGSGGAVAKVTATLDSSEVETTSDTFDPEASAVRSERRVVEQTTQEGAGPAGVAGAAANQPLNPAAGGGTSGGRGGMNREDELKNYEISKTVTRSVTRAPRVKRLSVAVLVDGVDGKPRPAAEIARLAELAKSAVGFEAARGDKFEISSSPFNRAGAHAAGEPGGFFATAKGRYAMIGSGVAALLLLGFIVMMLSRGRKAKAVTAELALIRPGKRVGDAEKALAGEEPQAIPSLPSPAAAALPGSDPNVNVRDKARELAGVDPARAAKILKAWIDSDHERREAA